MINIFRRKKQEKSIYEKLLNFIEKDEKINLSFKEIKEENSDICGLKKALFDFYNKDSAAIREFDNYFKDHKFYLIKNKFETYLFSIDNFDSQRLVGLSILLMRNSQEKESVKCGIYLCNFYQLENVPAAIKILAKLALVEEFRQQSFRILKNLGIYEPIRDSILREIEKEKYKK